MDRLVNLDSVKVKEFYKQMCDIYDVKIVDKSDSLLMKALGQILDIITPISNDKFLNKYSTTLYNKIYVPFEIGDCNEKDLVYQVSTLIHELIHVRQFQNNPIMPILYVYSTSERALFEAEAWSANVEFKVRRYGNKFTMNFDSYGDKFKNYQGTDEDTKVISAKLKSDYLMYIQDIKVSPIVETAIEILIDLGCWK